MQQFLGHSDLMAYLAMMAVRLIELHRLRRRALGGAGGLCHLGRHHQAVPVLHDHMPHVAQLRRLSRRLLIEPRIRVGGGGVRLIAAVDPLRGSTAMEITLAGAPRRRRFAAAVLAAEALHRCPGLDQRAVHREMLVRQQWPNPTGC